MVAPETASNLTFVTGFPRSGTTLVDRILDSHSSFFFLSQPLPLLFVELKKAFLAAEQEHGRYSGITSMPLNDVFGANWYPPQAFTNYLEHRLLDDAFCRPILESMVDFSGQYTKPDTPLAVLDSWRGGNLVDFLKTYYTQFEGASKATWLGSKEIGCEEYLPYLVAAGAKTILVIRDPRDAITSANYGRGTQHAGTPKPLLFSIRNWRKSVAYALALKEHPEFHLLRYEDLVADPREEIRKLGQFLGTEELSPPDSQHELQDSKGGIWESNSSHGAKQGVDASSVGRYREFLPAEAQQLIEATCYPEMRSMGYETAINQSQVEECLKIPSFQEELCRPELAGYNWDQDRSAEELERWRTLTNGGESGTHFPFPETAKTLRQALEST